MINYVSAIAVDFGSTDSGCARVIDKDEEGRIMFKAPDYVQAMPNYVKDSTWFLSRHCS